MPKDQSDKKFSVAKSRASEHAHELDQIGDDYLRQFISLRELSQLAEITSTAKSRQAWLDSIDVGMLDDQDKKEFNEFIKNLITAFATTIGIEVRDPKSGEVMPPATPNEDGTTFSVRVRSPEVSAIAASIFRNIHRALAPDKGEMIAQSLITIAVSRFEVLVGSVAKAVFKINKSALEKSEYEFTLEELMKFDSIDEAVMELISRRVDALLLKSIDDWSKWCERVLQFNLASLTSNWPAVREIFARRNIIIHNEGKVNRRYLAIAEEAGVDLPTDVAIGDELVTDQAYVNEAIQLVLSLGLALIYSTWKKLYPRTESDAAEWLVSRLEVIVYDEMWLAARELSRYVKNSKSRRATQYLGNVYEWFARKKAYGIESINEEVSAWDTSGLDTMFVIYKALLLDDVELARGLIEKYAGQSPFTRYDISVNPIFSEFRAYASEQSAEQSDTSDDPPSNMPRDPVDPGS